MGLESDHEAGAFSSSQRRPRRTRVSNPRPGELPLPAPPRPRGAGSRCRCACAAGAGRGRAAGVTLRHGAGGAAPRAAPGGPRPAAPQRCRGVLQASPGHVLVLRQGGAGAADPRRDPQGHRQHEGAGQELPERPPGADHRQGSTEERFGGHRGADVVLHW